MKQHSDDFDPHAEGYTETLDASVAWSGGGGEAFAGHKVGVLRRHCPRPKRILDYGCGVGLLGEAMAEAFPEAEIDGQDLSEASLARVSERLHSRGRYVSDLEQLEGGYDLVVTSNVLHHVAPGERAEFMAQGARRLSPGGAFAVFEHNPLNPMTRWVVATCEFDEDAILLWPRETLALLRGAGLNTTRKEAILFFPPALSALWPLERHLSWLPLGAQYFAMGVKA